MNIDSNYYSNKLETDIILLIKAISVERKTTIEEAKILGREIVQIKLNSTLSEQEKEDIDFLIKTTISELKKDSNNKIYKKLYNMLHNFKLI